ncbi:MAG TPA: glycosyl hydrolase, partial [Terracidiphilus sp.]|nr:glycosyl hydrolase [Terracidiphilus sp.]
MRPAQQRAHKELRMKPATFPFSPLSPGTLRTGLALLTLSAALSVSCFAQQLHPQFLNPPPDARPIMRWWWFGPSVTKPELRKELETMRGAGIGGVEIQPVYPLSPDDPAKGIVNFPYLSPSFLGDVAFANSTAHALGLRVDITLGSGWPYGGPHTPLALAAGKLRVASVPITEGHITPPALKPGESLIAAFAVEGSANSFSAATAHRIPLEGGSAPAGTQTALFFIAGHTHQQVKRAAFGAEGYVLDHFSRAAIDKHLKDVATPLLDAFGYQPPTAVFSDSLEVFSSDWTDNLPAEFQRLRGYNLIPHLPALLAGGTPEAEAVRHDWGETLSDLIRENYLAPITAFAHAHHTLFRSQTYGEPAVTLADEAVPDLPEGEGPQWQSFSFTRWASSASHLYGRPVTSAETWTWLHSPAFRATPLDMKAEADRMFLLGINQIVGHGYPYSPPAAGEPGWTFYAAGAFNAHNPWFPVMPDVMKYLQRMSWLLRQGKPANDVAILLPEDDAQAAFTPGHVSVTDEMKHLITPGLMSAILNAGYNIDYVDAATLLKLGSVPYPVLILPPTQRIPLAAYKLIDRYASSGGKLIAVGTLPSLAPELMEQNESPQIAALSAALFHAAGHHGVLVSSVEELPAALHTALAPDLDAQGQVAGLGFIHRRLPGSDIYFLADTSNQPIHGSIRFRSVHSAAQAWSPDSGAVLASYSLANGARIPLALAPYESRVFIMRNHFAGSPPPENSSLRTAHVFDLSAGWSIRFAEGTQSLPLPSFTSWTDLPG